MTQTPTPEYLPWSTDVREGLLYDWRLGRLGALDLEMSAKCKHGACVYCDSEINTDLERELSWSELRGVITEAIALGLRWIYICGLGEPMDDPNFWDLVQMGSEAGLSFSVFTNGLALDRQRAEFLLQANVNLILKLDSLNAEHFDSLLGKEGTAYQIYKNLAMLIEAGFAGGDSTTHLALSIVPTRRNLMDILGVVRFCIDNRIFPSIGELEGAGRAVSLLSELDLSRTTLLALRKEVEAVYGCDYCRPVCPATCTSLHIDRRGQVVVDRLTGLSCSWFRLTSPDLSVVGNVTGHRLREICQTVAALRSNLKPDSGATHARPNVFGGCGGFEEAIVTAAAGAAWLSGSCGDAA